MRQVAAGVHAVRLIGSTSHLIVEDGGLTLVDAGHRGSSALLTKQLAQIGRSPRDIVRVICTHGHPDHIGGVQEVVALSGATVHLHPADATRLRTTVWDVMREPRPGTILAFLTREIPDVQPLADGDVIPVLGGLRVVHTPGHTPGSVCLYAARDRVLFTGDVLQLTNGRLALPHRVFSDDLGLAKRSIARLAALDVDTICFAHYPALRGDPRGALQALAS